MAIYTGEVCPVCEKAFQEADDVVVCPICGAPHHRGCYKENHNCAYADKHDDHYVWTPTVTQQAKTGGAVVCRVCGTENPAGSTECQRCGTELASFSREPGSAFRPDETIWGQNGGQNRQQSGDSQEAFPSDWAFSGFSPAAAYLAAMGGVAADTDFDGVSARDLAIFIGDRSYYFLPRFAAMKANSRFRSFNFAAFVFGVPYFFYRKMYKAGLAFLAAFILLQIPALLIMPQWTAFVADHFGQIMMGFDVTAQFTLTSFQWVPQIQPYLQLLSAVVLVVGGMNANRIYYHTCVERIKRARQACEEKTGSFDDIAFGQSLALWGRTSIGSAVLVVAVSVAAYFGVVYIFALPYMDKMVQAFLEMK